MKMAQIGNIPEIVEVKTLLNRLQREGLVLAWELPYENLLTRRSAAIFFLTPASEANLSEIWEQLGQFDHFRVSKSKEKTLSQLEYRVEFNQDKV